MSHVTHDSPTNHSPDAPADGDQLARQLAIRQIERRRRLPARRLAADRGGARLGRLREQADFRERDQAGDRASVQPAEVSDSALRPWPHESGDVTTSNRPGGKLSSGGSTFTIANEIMPTLKQLPGVHWVKIYDQKGHTERPFGHSDSIPFSLEP